MPLAPHTNPPALGRAFVAFAMFLDALKELVEQLDHGPCSCTSPQGCQCPADPRHIEPPAHALVPAVQPSAPPSGNGLKRVHMQLLAKATQAPIPTKQLIRAAGYDPNSYARDAVTYLCRNGYLERTPDGVRLPARRPAA
jgi:hypothetical protein